MTVPTTTETRIVIRDVVPLTTTAVDTRTSLIRFLHRCLSCTRPNRALFHTTTATTVENSDSTNHQATAITRSSRLPLGLHGIISEPVFDHFCATVNEQINAHEAILTRRRKYIFYQNLIYILCLAIMMHFVYGPLFHEDHSMLNVFLISVLTTAIFFAVLFVSYSYFKHPIQQVIHGQNNIYQNVNDVCSDLIRSISPPPPQQQSSMSSSSPHVTCTLESLGCHDDIGRYNDMDHIKFTVTTTANTRAASTDEHHNDDYVATTPDLNHIAAVNDNLTSLLVIL